MRVLHSVGSPRRDRGGKAGQACNYGYHQGFYQAAVSAQSLVLWARARGCSGGCRSCFRECITPCVLSLPKGKGRSFVLSKVMPRRGRARYRGTFQPVTGRAGTGNSGSTGAAIVGQFVGEVDHSNTVRVSGTHLFNQYSSNDLLPLAVVWNHHQFVGGNQFSRGGHDTFTGLVGMSASAGGIVARGQPSSPPP